MLLCRLDRRDGTYLDIPQHCVLVGSSVQWSGTVNCTSVPPTCRIQPVTKSQLNRPTVCTRPTADYSQIHAYHKHILNKITFQLFRCSNWCSCFLFRMSRVQIPTRRSDKFCSVSFRRVPPGRCSGVTQRIPLTHSLINLKYYISLLSQMRIIRCCLRSKIAVCPVLQHFYLYFNLSRNFSMIL